MRSGTRKIDLNVLFYFSRLVMISVISDHVRLDNFIKTH